MSGGYFANDEFNGGAVDSFGRQQFFTRNSTIDSWSNGVWNQVFLGDNGAPAAGFGPGTNQYTTLPSTPVSQEKPFLRSTPTGGTACCARGPAQLRRALIKNSVAQPNFVGSVP